MTVTCVEGHIGDNYSKDYDYNRRQDYDYIRGRDYDYNRGQDYDYYNISISGNFHLSYPPPSSREVESLESLTCNTFVEGGELGGGEGDLWWYEATTD